MPLLTSLTIWSIINDNTVASLQLFLLCDQLSDIQQVSKQRLVGLSRIAEACQAIAHLRGSAFKVAELKSMKIL